MALTTDLPTFTSESSHYGECIARTNRILAKLLYGWTRAKEANGKARPHYLTAIYFDKLAELFCRLWDQLSEDRAVRFRSAYRSCRGIHGPGRAMRIDRKRDDQENLGKDPDDYRRHKFAYTTEIAEKLGQPFGRARSLFELGTAQAWSYKCRVSPQIWPNQWESWLNGDGEDGESTFLTPRELDLVVKISELVKGLTKKQLRALGTHCGAAQTVKAIEFNIQHFEDRFEAVVSLLRRGDLQKSALDMAQLVLFVAEEINNKSVANRKDYEGGRNCVKEVLAAKSDKELEQAFNLVQCDPVEVWVNDPTVARYAENVRAILALSQYVLGCVRLISGTQTSEDEIALTRSSVECLVEFETSLRPVLPTISEIREENREKVANACVEAKVAIWRHLPVLPRRRNLGLPGEDRGNGDDE